ncbi:MAG TPA: ATP-dependent zinc metalloprotease FtsH [Phycisphaerae bacterium]|nr:ATP-dependent zinc metalloprotease FtsH [Phycisphaerae bacterium]
MRGPKLPDDNPNDEGTPPPSRMRGLLGWGLLFGLAILVVYALTQHLTRSPEFSREQLYKLLAEPEAVKRIWVHGNIVSGEINPAPEFQNQYKTDTFTVHLQDEEVARYIARLEDNEAVRAKFMNADNQSFTPDNPFLWQMLIYTMPLLILLLLLWFFVSRQMRTAAGGGILSFGRSRARLAKKERVKVTFDDVAGIEEAKEEVQEIIEFLKNPQRFQVLGGRIPRGVMLVGPPGTGKTLLAKAIAGEADVPFFSISGSDFVEMFVGVGASRVRDLFQQAKASSPCIIFLDEIDAVGRRRGMGFTGGHDEREQTLNAILVEMDGFDTNEQVIIIGATNRPDVLDPALRRPGRFDREVVIHFPDLNEREAILKVHAKNIKLAEAVDLAIVARGTPGFTGADLAAITNEAAIRATLLSKSAVEQDDLEEARDKVRWGRTKRSRAMDEEDRRLSAYHEGGHVLMSILLAPDVEPLHKVSIIPRGMMLGATMFLPEKDRYTIKRRQCLGQIKVAFAGRIAEELFFGDITSGAADDIRQATLIARRMVMDWGMSDRIGPVRYAPQEETTPWGGELSGPKEHSDATAHAIDEEVEAIVNNSYAEAKDLLERNREALRRIAEALLTRETLSADEVRQEIADLSLEKPAPAGPEPFGKAPSGTHKD